MAVRVFKPVDIIFIHLEKTGGSSIQKWLLTNTQASRFNKHCDVEYAKRLYPECNKFFTIVRNPYERYISWYFYMLEKTKQRISVAENGYNFRGHKSKKDSIYNLEKNKKLLAELEVGFNGYIKKIPIVPQYNNATQCDIILKLENIKNDFKIIQDLLGIEKPLGRVNSSTHSHYRNYYNTESKNFVYEMNEMDFKTFNYEF